MKTALIAGCTGLIGAQLLDMLLKDDRYGKVIAISRRSLDKTGSPKLQNLVADLDTLGQFRNSLHADDVFCCLGTTMRQARTREAFRRVDFDYPVALATMTKAEGASQFLLVSALGANKSSSIFYNRVKGETEEAIAGLEFESYHIFRPSLLLGPRTDHRAGESAAKRVYRALAFLIPRKYKAIESSKVARAMMVHSATEQKGNHIHESDQAQSF